MSSGVLEIENPKVLESWKTIIATSSWATFNIHVPGFSYSLPNRFCCQKKILIASASIMEFIFFLECVGELCVVVLIDRKSGPKSWSS
jgi:hypothetical protein